jgi:hypothetical protein
MRVFARRRPTAKIAPRVPVSPGAFERWTATRGAPQARTRAVPRVMTLEDAIARYEATKAAAIATARDAAVRAREEATRAQRVVMNAPAPALAARFARADGFVDRGAYPVFVERIAVGSVIFSQSYARDAWLHVKNNHLLVALFMAHPKHPFSRTERAVCLFCSLIMGFGLTCAFGLIADEPDKTVVSVIVGGFIQGVYDALLRMFAECICIQSCPRCVVNCFETCGRIGMVLQFLLGILVLCIGFLAFVTSESLRALGGVTWRFAMSKASSWVVASMIFVLLGHHLARRNQMRPAASRHTFSEKEAHERWNTPQEPWCCSCCLPSRAPSYFWNYYIGEDVSFEDLPMKPPKYAVKNFGCVCGQDEDDEDGVPAQL